jgi:hypothetical protein
MSDAEKVTYDFANAQNLSGTGSQRTAEMKVGHWYALFVGNTAVRVTSGGDSITADSDDPYIAAGSVVPFNLNDAYVAVIGEDGAAHVAHLVPASPGAGAA